ncbi:MAG: hypothetical protein WAN27_05905, partial [Xanthobacteraceae bacterium]
GNNRESFHGTEESHFLSPFALWMADRVTETDVLRFGRSTSSDNIIVSEGNRKLLRRLRKRKCWLVRDSIL